MPSHDYTFIERIVLNGGGAKGFGYPGVYQALHDAELLDRLDSISGASIGSIFGSMIAVGAKPHVLRQKLLEHNLFELVNHQALLGPNIVPGITVRLDVIEEFLNRHLIETVSEFLKAQANLTQEMQTLLDEILKKDHKLSFGELYQLHEKYPKQFKKLSVVAAKMGAYQLTVFDHKKETKDISIAQACMASSAWPVIFAPVKINGIYYQDGGLIDALPSEYFISNDLEQSKAEQFKKTLLFVFYFSFFEDAVNNKKKGISPLVKSVLILADILLIPFVNLPFYLINFTFFILKLVCYLLFIVPYLIISANFNKINSLFSDLLDVFCSLFSVPVIFSLSVTANDLYTRINERYPDRTILLNSGKIGSNDFALDLETTKTFHALYYLETIEYLMINKLHNGSFIADENTFYKKIVLNYKKIDDSLQIDDLDDFKTTYLKIKKIANENYTSATAATLTKAIEQLYINPISNRHSIEQYNSRDRLFSASSQERLSSAVDATSPFQTEKTKRSDSIDLEPSPQLSPSAF